MNVASRSCNVVEGYTLRSECCFDCLFWALSLLTFGPHYSVWLLLFLLGSTLLLTGHFFPENFMVQAMVNELMLRRAELVESSYSAACADTVQEDFGSSSTVSFKAQFFVNNE